MIANLSSTLLDRSIKGIMPSPVRKLNSRPLVYKTSALTTELTRRPLMNGLTKMALESINDMSLLARGFFIFYFFKTTKMLQLTDARR